MDCLISYVRRTKVAAMLIHSNDGAFFEDNCYLGVKINQ